MRISVKMFVIMIVTFISMTFLIGSSLAKQDDVQPVTPSSPKQIAPLTPKPTIPVSPRVNIPPLPITIDSIHSEPEWFIEGQESLSLSIKGTRTQSGETLRGGTLIITRDGRQVYRSLNHVIRGETGPFGIAIPFHRVAGPGIYRVELIFGGQSYVSREFRTETMTRYRFSR
jgi:hypothetical protein